MSEYRTVLAVSSEFISKRSAGEDVEKLGSSGSEILEEELVIQDLPNGISIGHIAGTIHVDEVDRMKRMIFRATRGKALSYFKEIKTPTIDFTGRKIHKAVFVVLFQEGDYMRKRITSAADSFLGQKFEIPTSGIAKKIEEIHRNLDNTKEVKRVTSLQMKKYLNAINHKYETFVSTVEMNKWLILKEQSIYNNLNKMK